MTESSSTPLDRRKLPKSPMQFKCLKARGPRSHAGGDHRDVERTGRSRVPKNPNRPLGIRAMEHECEYRCKICGFTGWSNHTDLMKADLVKGAKGVLLKSMPKSAKRPLAAATKLPEAPAVTFDAATQPHKPNRPTQRVIDARVKIKAQAHELAGEFKAEWKTELDRAGDLLKQHRIDAGERCG